MAAPYSVEITRLLTNQLTKFVTLNRHQLAGHVANLDFWLDEARHCLAVIDGYHRRFEQLRAAQGKYVVEHQTVEFDLEHPYGDPQPASPPRRVPGQELKEARQSLCEAVERFLTRCVKKGLLDETALQETCEQLGLDASQFRAY